MSKSRKELDKEAIRNEYVAKYSKYERLAKNLKTALEKLFKDAGIDVLDINYRIKDFDSFGEKMLRKGYKDPFKEMEDICGLRVICYYSSDLEKITQIINREFDVEESINKAGLLEPDRFGYRSLHFIITVKPDWLIAPTYRGLDGLKAEVQVRTILMHAWADVEHKLAYKKTEHIPDRFKRALYRLSALFEVADEQFENLRQNRENYLNQLVSEEVKESRQFDVSQAMNLDSLQAFLNFYLENLEVRREWTRLLLDELMHLNLSFRDIADGFKDINDFLPEIEKDLMKISQSEYDFHWKQLGVARLVLDLTNDAYLEWREREKQIPKIYRELEKKWKSKIAKVRA